jgi:competence protein ComEA
MLTRPHYGGKFPIQGEIHMNIKEFLKMHAYYLLGGACIIIVGIIFVISRGTEAEIIRSDEVSYRAAEEENSSEASSIFIHIVGAVNSPGLIELPADARVFDAIELAGGATADADLNRVNLAARLQDATQLFIPFEGEEIPEAFAAPEGNASGLVNINTATTADLQTLPNIGPVLAQNIIDFREAHGGFSSVDELIHVNRIGEATLERLRPLVTVD